MSKYDIMTPLKDLIFMKIYLAGDSTVASFNDSTYYYPRFGYGTKLQNYFNNTEVINLALSGRSSKSFLKEENYRILKSSIKEGDYLIIGFGHNDEKSDDESRFTDASKPLDNPSSFAYSLYNNYIKLALDVHATPILCSPICRINPNNEYNGNTIHDTKTGNYKDAILKLAREKGLLGIDLTSKTVEDAKEGFDKSALYHAMTAGRLKDGNLSYDITSVDKTHLNEYGANLVAYYVVDAIKNSNLDLKKYIISDYKRPDISYLHMNPLYKLPHYIVPNMKSYLPQDRSFSSDGKFYGLAFGSLSATDLSNKGFVAYKENDCYIVGQCGEKRLGALCSTYDGICGVFRQLSIKENFIVEADVEIISTNFGDQSGFGIMLRDDLYLNQKTANEIISSNYICAGVITDAKSFVVNYKKESTTEISRTNNVVHHPYENGDKFKLYLERLGQRLVVKAQGKDFGFENEYLDFDFQAHDFNNIYLGFFATKGTIAKYSNINFKITGNAKEA